MSCRVRAARSEAEVSSDTSEYGTPAGTFSCGGCRGIIFCHATFVTTASSASARVAPMATPGSTAWVGSKRIIADSPEQMCEMVLALATAKLFEVRQM